MEEIIPFAVKHFTNIGDLIASLCACKKIYDKTGRKVNYFQQIGMPAQYYQGAVHPTVNSEGVNVCMNQKMWEMTKPLLLSQYYIHGAEEYTGQKINCDFDIIRGDKFFVNLPNGSIQAWLMYAYPDLCNDISKPWIFLPDECPKHILDQVNGKVLLNFTERYRNPHIDYFFLKDYAKDLIFAGTQREHLLFCNTWGVDMPLLKTNDFLEVAFALKFSRFFLGNQSWQWNTAEAIKSKRILEVCRYAQNCLPFYGEDSYGYLHKEGAVYYFELLYEKTAPKKGLAL